MRAAMRKRACLKGSGVGGSSRAALPDPDPKLQASPEVSVDLSIVDILDPAPAPKFQVSLMAGSLSADIGLALVPERSNAAIRPPSLGAFISPFCNAHW